jgi:methionyl aminopeptidase
MSIDSEVDLRGMKEASKVAVEARDSLAAAAEPGVTPHDLDELCGEINNPHQRWGFAAAL